LLNVRYCVRLASSALTNAAVVKAIAIAAVAAIPSLCANIVPSFSFDERDCPPCSSLDA
jgi:hypothetical protein